MKNETGFTSSHMFRKTALRGTIFVFIFLPLSFCLPLPASLKQGDRKRAAEK